MIDLICVAKGALVLGLGLTLIASAILFGYDKYRNP